MGLLFCAAGGQELGSGSQAYGLPPHRAPVLLNLVAIPKTGHCPGGRYSHLWDGIGRSHRGQCPDPEWCPQYALHLSCPVPSSQALLGAA